jgi:hypothetical protein
VKHPTVIAAAAAVDAAAPDLEVGSASSSTPELEQAPAPRVGIVEPEKVR